MRKFYALQLSETNQKTGLTRFSVYEHTPKGLELFWPKDPHNGINAEMPIFMVYSKRKHYPAFHFAVDGWGINRTFEIGVSLALYFNEEIEIEDIDGWNPSNHHEINPTDWKE